MNNVWTSASPKRSLDFTSSMRYSSAGRLQPLNVVTYGEPLFIKRNYG